jgi:DNA-binding MarR family transcriptional regulator
MIEQNTASIVVDTILLGMQMVRRKLRSARPADLSVPQFRVMGFLKRNPGSSLSEVAEHIGLMLPSMSKNVDALVNRGFVNREPSINDRRRIILSLTHKGNEAYQLAWRSSLTNVARMLSNISPEEQKVVFQAMEILKSVFTAEQKVHKNDS